jgi:hypothetical protein
MRSFADALDVQTWDVISYVEILFLKSTSNKKIETLFHVASTFQLENAEENARSQQHLS